VASAESPRQCSPGSVNVAQDEEDEQDTATTKPFATDETACIRNCYRPEEACILNCYDQKRLASLTATTRRGLHPKLLQTRGLHPELLPEHTKCYRVACIPNCYRQRSREVGVLQHARVVGSHMGGPLMDMFERSNSAQPHHIHINITSILSWWRISDVRSPGTGCFASCSGSWRISQLRDGVSGWSRRPVSPLALVTSLPSRSTHTKVSRRSVTVWDVRGWLLQ